MCNWQFLAVYGSVYSMNSFKRRHKICSKLLHVFTLTLNISSDKSILEGTDDFFPLKGVSLVTLCVYYLIKLRPIFCCQTQHGSPLVPFSLTAAYPKVFLFNSFLHFSHFSFSLLHSQSYPLW